MAFTSTLAAAIGLATKLSHLDEVFQNTKWLKDKILGDGAEGSGASGHEHPPGYADALQVEVGTGINGVAETYSTAFTTSVATVVAPTANVSRHAEQYALTTTQFTPYTDAGSVMWIAVKASVHS